MPTRYTGWTFSDFVTQKECDYLNALYDQLCETHKTGKTVQFIRSLSTPSVVQADDRVQSHHAQELNLRSIVASIEERVRLALPSTVLNAAGQECRFVGVGESLTVSVHRGPSRGIGRHVDSQKHTEFNSLHAARANAATASNDDAAAAAAAAAAAEAVDGKTDAKANVYPIECLYKFAVYLSKTSSAGTAFYENKKAKHPAYVTDGTARSAMIFDMREWHSGTEIAAGTEKRVFGLRLFFQRI